MRTGVAFLRVIVDWIQGSKSFELLSNSEITSPEYEATLITANYVKKDLPYESKAL